MPPASRWPDAALSGLASSMRTFSPVLAHAARGRIGGRQRAAAFALGGGELLYDKLPFALSRIEAPSLGARIASGAIGGAAVAGPAGAAAGGATAAVGTFAAYRARKLLGDQLGVPAVWAGVVEDVAAVSAAAIATREPDPEESAGEAPRPSALKSAAQGLAAGVAGTAAMTVAQGAYYQLTDAQMSRAPAKVGQMVLEQTLGTKVKRKHVPALNQVMHWGYGSAWGIPYGLLASSRPEQTGAGFGLVVLGASFIQLPALGLAPPPWKRTVESLATETAFHVIYGLGAAGALRAIRR